MKSPHLFKRSPRILPDLPSGEVEIVAPSSPPSAVTTSLITILIPIGVTIVGVAFMAMLSDASTAIVMGVIMMGTYVVSIINYQNQRKKFKKETEDRQQKYHRYLTEVHKDLEAMYRQQGDALHQVDPSPHECLARATRLPPDSRLWERSKKDLDFLSLRIGLGDQPFRVNIKLPRMDPTQDPDPLIQEAYKMGKAFEVVKTVPANFPLLETGAGGLAGQRSLVLNLVRTLVLQIASHHAPSEVKVVAVFPANEREQWEWMRWLPHVWNNDHRQRFLACHSDAAHAMMVSLDSEFRARKRKKEADRDTKTIPLPRYVLILADPTLAENEPILPLVLREGSELGAYPIFLADRPDDLPQGCRAIAQVGPVASFLIRTDDPGRSEFEPDQANVDMADRFARALAPIQLQRMVTAVDIPEKVTLLDILGVNRVEGLDVPSRWRKSEPNKSLAVPIGRKAGGELIMLDLHEKGHGPNGLGAGTVGSGKSELLQSLVVALAADFHPHELSFVLIDYKGGGMSNLFEELPHLVGTITNLEGNLAARALRALHAEMKRRQTLLADAGVNNINPYIQKVRRGEVKKPMPHLVIVVDEFAELATQMPDFMNEMVSAARVGRSLGVHLILTTQKPAGVVNEQIWSNSRFRFCLRVERAEDSRDVLRRPDAANLSRPGQAYLQVGNDEIFDQFQSAWSMAPYQPGGFAVRDPHEVLEVSLDGTRQTLRLSPKPTRIEAVDTQLEAIISHIRQVSESMSLERLPGPWLPPLPTQLQLSETRPDGGWDGNLWQPNAAWMQPVVGLLDDPERQLQDPLRIDLGKEGHLAIYGAPGTGKTTLLQTLIISLALDHSPEDVNLYLLDFGARILTLFDGLPHVGGVILSDDEDRLGRLLRYLQRQLEIRKELFAKAGVSSLKAYRKTAGESIPAIVVVIDNYPGFTSALPDDTAIAQLSREGGNLGIHLVLAANSPSQIRIRVSNNITMAIALQLADRSDYSQAVGRTGGLEPAQNPGRGLVKGKPPKEFQTALPAPGDQEADRTKYLQQIITSMSAWLGPRARSIPVPPKVLALTDLLTPVDKYLELDEKEPFAVPLGLDFEDLDPLSVDLSSCPNFLITGPIQSGKTTLLQSWLLALVERFPPERLQLYLVDYQQEGLFPFQRLPHTRAYVTHEDLLGEALGEIAYEIQSRRAARDKALKETDTTTIIRKRVLTGFPAIVLAIDDFDLFNSQTQPGIQDRLEQLMRRSRGLGLNVLLAASINDVTSGFSKVMKTVKNAPTGFLLGSTDNSHLNVFNVRLPVGEAGQMLPAGEGIYAQRGKYQKVKVATPWEGDVPIQEWIESIAKRKSTKRRRRKK